ncbi:MAG: methionyl-tRNA formyltransferase [Candidatus Lambdaproteobacteria bacterium]|nr:methionyl-tRNA formyltransferase [Candidatus Lambdaproteobacteria bacterium]
MTRVVFMGSPDMALPSLRVLAAHPQVTLAGVISQPDRPAGRARREQPCPVKTEAMAMGLPVATPLKAGGPEGLAQLQDFDPALIVVCAYGQILPERLLALPPLGCFNLHFSLLPRWRGASPVQAALLAGDTHTGVSLQRMVLALDAGPLVACTPPLPIAPHDTAGSLGERLAAVAGDLLRDTLPVLLCGHPPLTPQDDARATFCRTIKKAQGAVNWAAESAQEIERKRRAYTPWPGCYGYLGARRIAFEALRVVQAGDGAPSGATAAAPGVLQAGGIVAAREGAVQLLRVKPEGKAAMDIEAFLNGAPDALGGTFMPGPPAG